MNHAIPFPPCRTLLGLVLFLAATTPTAAQIPGALEAEDDFGRAVATGDFNGDGFTDLAVGVPGEDVFVGGSTFVGAGGVNLIYGTATGLDDAGSRFWGQSNAGVEDDPEAEDAFGYAVASADFDGDGFDDLAVGVPFEGVGTDSDAGAVNVLYGSSSGLSAAGDQLWHQDVPGVLGGAEAEDQFGWSLAAGDFDGDTFDDLAVGVRNEGAGAINTAGGVQLLYGSSGIGLSAAGNQFWGQSIAGVLDDAETTDFFGWSLAAGDFDGDTFDDLAVGVPLEDVGIAVDAGVVHVLYGSAGVGLGTARNQLWGQNSTGVLDDAETGDLFGYALAAEDFDADGLADLAIGVAGETVGSVSSAGALSVLYGSNGVGLTATGNQVWYQGVSGVLDTAEASDNFGSAVTSGDFDGDGYGDLAVGAPNEDVGAVAGAGAVSALYGSSGGLTATGSQFWHQDVVGVLEAAESIEVFGASLAVGDFDGDGFDDLAVGVPEETVGSVDDPGSVHALYGAGGVGLTEAGDQLWHQGGTGTALSEGPEQTLAAGAPDAPAASAVEGPAVLAFLPASPNPSHAQATLRFSLPEGGPVRLAVYDALGREVALVVDERREAGPHAVAFHARSLPSGAYLVRLEAAGRVLTQRLTLVR